MNGKMPERVYKTCRLIKEKETCEDCMCSVTECADKVMETFDKFCEYTRLRLLFEEGKTL